MLANLLTEKNVDVLCVQEVHVVDFLGLPPNQPFAYDGPVGCRRREAGLLVRGCVTGLTLPGVEDVLLMRWRVFENSVCICTFYARHAGLPEGERVACRQDLLQVARHVRAMSYLPMILAGDANVRHHFASKGGADEEAIVVSNPFVALYLDRIAVPSIHPVCGSFPEAGRARLTRFLGMSSDNSYATVSEMVSLGRFQHTGHATVRIEGASAWGMSSGGSLAHCT